MGLKKYFHDRAAAKKACVQETAAFSKVFCEIAATDLSKKSLSELQALSDTLNPRKNEAAAKYLRVAADASYVIILNERDRIDGAIRYRLQRQHELEMFDAKLALIAARFGQAGAGKIGALLPLIEEDTEGKAATEKTQAPQAAKAPEVQKP